ncbi:MAG: hypothetical protein JST92_21560 [Deltaproteobacteria bacterium]|nr:hypothetical protein [Deltaproteobacteria bacterium]
MSLQGHLSRLDLDRLVLAPQGVPGEITAHLASCAACRERLEASQSEKARVAADPGFEATFKRLPKESPAPRRRLWTLAAAVGSIAALGVAWVTLTTAPREGDRRLKGSASILLVDADGREVRTPHVGQPLELRVHVGPHQAALVLAFADGAPPALLWPAHGDESGVLDPDARVTVPLRVTPGSVRVLAVFSAHPVKLADATSGRLPADAELRILTVRPSP